MASPELVFLQDLTVITLVAAAATILFQRLKQPVVLGYLLAGLVVGPYTPPFALVRDEATVSVLGHVGIVILLFAVGLEFNFRKLRTVGFSAVIAALLGTSLLISLGFGVGRAFGLAPLEAAFLGAIMSVSSTTIIVRVLQEMGDRDKPWARFILGITLIEDVLAVIVLAVLSGAAATGADEFTFAAVGGLLLRLLLFLGATLVLGTLIVPRLVGYVARMRVDEMLVLAAVGLAFGLALLAAQLGFSTALGAFVMGVLVAESAAVRQVELKVAPIRDLFVAIFFVTIGMLLDPRALITHAPLVFAVVAAVIAGRIVASSFATFVTGHDPAFALRVGFGLVPLGEFSFIIAGLAISTGVTQAPFDAIAVAGSVITAFAAPILLKRAGGAAALVQRAAPRPVLTYARVYARWLSRLSHLQRRDPARLHVVQESVRALLYGSVLVAVTAIGARSVEAIGRVVAPRIVVGAEAVFLVGWSVVALVALPFLVLFARALLRLVEALAEAALPERLAATDTGRYVQAVLRRTFVLTGSLVAGILLFVVASPFLPTGPTLIAAAAIVATLIVASGAYLYNALARFQERVDETLSGVLSGDDPIVQREEREGILALVREQYPWGVAAREVLVPDDSGSVHRSLRELNLRSRTGATLVGIHRGEEALLNPDPDALVLPGDRLVVVGEDDQVRAAETLLRAPAPPRVVVPAEPMRWREARVRTGSPLAGRTLAQSAMRERTGATVVGIVRAGERIMSPPPDFRIAVGDVLLLMGAEAEVERATDEASGARD